VFVLAKRILHERTTNYTFAGNMNLLNVVLLFALMGVIKAESPKSWTLKTDLITGKPFGFDFIVDNSSDFSQGLTKNLDAIDAELHGLISRKDDAMYIGVDFENILPTDMSTGRESINLRSRSPLYEGLYIFEIKHMPSAACGLWSVIRLVDDTLMGFEIAPQSMTFLATTPSEQCFISKDSSPPIITEVPYTSFESAFNNANGGTYAIEWKADVVSVWEWVRDDVPADVKNGTSPDPSTWGPAWIQYKGNCQQRLHIQIWTTFCAPWAQNDYYNSTCFRTAPICTHYVAQNPSAFQDAYVSIPPESINPILSRKPASKTWIMSVYSTYGYSSHLESQTLIRYSSSGLSNQ